MPHQASSFWSRFFVPRWGVRPCSWSLPKEAHRGPVRHHVCPPSLPLNEASISGPTALFCPLPPNQDQMVGVLGWKGTSRQQTQVSCRCLPMFVRHTSSKEIARCKSVRSGRVGTSHDPTALAVSFLQSGWLSQSGKFSQTGRGKQRDIGVNRCARHMW